MRNALWSTDRDGTFSAEIGSLALTVRESPKEPGIFRFTVLRRDKATSGSDVILCSGQEGSVAAAMAAAEEAATRRTSFGSNLEGSDC